MSASLLLAAGNRFVAVGEEQGLLVRGSRCDKERSKSDYSDIAGVGVGLAAYSPPQGVHPLSTPVPPHFQRNPNKTNERKTSPGLQVISPLWRTMNLYRI